jgi:hypothetical protein
MDGRLVEVTNPVDGTRWAAWAYRNGAEYDLAVAFRGDRGFWSDPTLIGIDDGVDQTQPALAVDDWGNIYLAFSERGPDRIMICWFEAGASEWTEPVSLTAPEVPAMYPALRVVGERLVVAFRSGRGSVILDMPLPRSEIDIEMIEDGPNPVGARDGHDSTDPNDDNNDPLVPFDDGSSGDWSSSSAS